VVTTKVLTKNVKTRRLACHRCLHRFSSLELTEAVVRAVGAKRVFAFARSAVAMRRVTQQRRERRLRIEQLLAEGWKATAIAHEVGLTEARIRQIRAEIARNQGVTT
jgi:hypothetical protein